MAKKPNKNIKVAQDTHKKVSKKSKPNVSGEEIKAIRSIQERYTAPIKRPKKELTKIKSELKSIRQPLYNLQAQLKRTTSKIKARAINKEIKKYNKAIDKPLDNLIQKRKDVKYLDKKFEFVRKEKVRLRSQITRYDKLIDKATENKDYKEAQRLTFQKIKELGGIDTLNAMLGMPVPKQDVSGYKADEDKDKKGFMEDPANPYTIWEAIEKLNEDTNSDYWKYIIINGNKYSIKNDIIQIVSEASSFWISVKQVKTKTPYVLRFINTGKKIVRYEPFK